MGLLRCKHLCSSESPHRRETSKCEECGKDFNYGANLRVLQGMELGRNSTKMMCEKGFFSQSIYPEVFKEFTEKKNLLYVISVIRALERTLSWHPSTSLHRREV